MTVFQWTGAHCLEEGSPFSNSGHPMGHYDLNVEVERETIAVQNDSGQSGHMCKGQRA